MKGINTAVIYMLCMLMCMCVGPSKRYRMKAIQTSKSCGIVSMYTSFATTDTNVRGQFDGRDARHAGARSSDDRMKWNTQTVK